MNSDYYIYIPVFLLTGIIFVMGSLLLSRLLAPQRFSPKKMSPYECGELPVGPAWIQYNVRFYLFAMIFVIFAVETVFLVPWAVVFRTLGIPGFLEMLLFMGILGVALVYAWRKGALEWVK